MKYISKMMLMAALAITMGLAAQSAKADTVTFSTTGVFSGGSGVVSNNGATVTFTSGGNTTTLTFTGNPSTTLNTPVGSNFGDITATSTDGAVPVSGNFTLSFMQTTPGPASTGSVGSTLSGSLGNNSGIATLTFNQTSVTINGITYTVNPMYTLAVPSSGAGGGAAPGVTSIQGTVTGSAVPEPTTMLLLGTGLTGLAGAARRRRMK